MKKAKSKARAPRKVKVKKPTALEQFTQTAEQAYNQRDGRVVTRKLSVLQFELQANEEHLQGLVASMGEVRRNKARIQAEVDGLLRVMNKR